MADDHIIIAGGGIGGFAAALALSHKGRPVKLLEQAAEFAEVGAGIQIGPNVFKMFDVLGVTEAISDVAVFPDNLVMRDALSGARITSVPIGSDAFRARYKYPYGVIYRPDLHDVLIAACAASPLVELAVAQKVTGFEDAGDKVRVLTEAGETHEGAALIGADGLWSGVREQLVRDGKPRVTGHIPYPPPSGYSAPPLSGVMKTILSLTAGALCALALSQPAEAFALIGEGFLGPGMTGDLALDPVGPALECVGIAK